MAVYKIPQDVEADDKFVGPLSFKQFIYCGIAGICGYLSFLSLAKGLWPALVILLPIITVFGFLGFPWGRDQPTEIWLAARIRFFIKPRIRVWNQSGIKDLVTITAPKKIERHYTNGLSQSEVSSRLSGLADLLDSRGWAVKNANVNLYASPVIMSDNADDDRLVGVSVLPQEVVEVTENDDILNEATNPTAQHFEQMIRDSETKHREEVMQHLESARAPQPTPQTVQAQTSQNTADFWFLQQGAHGGQHQSATQVMDAISTPVAPVEQNFTTFQGPAIVAPHAQQETAPTLEENMSANQAVSAQAEQALLEKVHKSHDASQNPFGHIKTIMPLGEGSAAPTAAASGVGVPQSQPTLPGVQPITAAITTPPTGPLPYQTPVAQQPSVQPVTPPVNPAIMNLAHNDDLDVATLARQAEKNQNPSDGEVVISLR